MSEIEVVRTENMSDEDATRITDGCDLCRSTIGWREIVYDIIFGNSGYECYVCEECACILRDKLNEAITTN